MVSVTKHDRCINVGRGGGGGGGGVRGRWRGVRGRWRGDTHMYVHRGVVCVGGENYTRTKRMQPHVADVWVTLLTHTVASWCLCVCVCVCVCGVYVWSVHI